MYLYFLLFNFLEMIGETLLSARNSRDLLRRGAIEIGPALLPVMAVLYVLMYIGSLLEFLGHSRSISVVWASIFVLLYCLAKALKFWAIGSLGRFWTMRVLIVPDSTVVKTGPYKWIRHPNYIAVLMEIAATTLLGKCFLTFVVVIILFSVTLVFRIRGEEEGLERHTNYGDTMTVRNRFIPK
jgi:methyltransferase